MFTNKEKSKKKIVDVLFRLIRVEWWLKKRFVFIEKI